MRSIPKITGMPKPAVFSRSTCISLRKRIKRPMAAGIHTAPRMSAEISFAICLRPAVYVLKNNAHKEKGAAKPYGPVPEIKGGNNEQETDKDEEVSEAEFHTLAG